MDILSNDDISNEYSLHIMIIYVLNNSIDQFLQCHKIMSILTCLRDDKSDDTVCNFL